MDEAFIENPKNIPILGESYTGTNALHGEKARRFVYLIAVVPIGGNPATSVVVLVLNVIVGASIGSLIAVFALLRAAVYMTRWIVNPGRDR